MKKPTHQQATLPPKHLINTIHKANDAQRMPEVEAEAKRQREGASK